jgi:hypothetical protein
MTTVWVLTLWNKPELIMEAVRSVQNQSKDYHVNHVVAQDKGTPKDQYRPGVFYDEIIEQITGMHDLICWLSDDDLMMTNYVADMAGFLEANPDKAACYGQSEHWAMNEKREAWKLRDIIGGPVYSAAVPPACQIDGGQAMYRRWVLDAIEKPLHDYSFDGCNISDGKLLNRIACVAPIYPIGKKVLINRSTWLSSHWRVVDNQMVYQNFRGE